MQLRQSARRLVRSPGFATLALGMLAVGIGINAGMLVGAPPVVALLVLSIPALMVPALRALRTNPATVLRTE